MMPLLLVGLFLAALAFGLWLLVRKSGRALKVAARLIAVVLACISAVVLMLSFLLSGMCGRRDFPPIKSVDGRLIAAVSEEDCGATDPFHSSVEIRGKSGSGTVFRSEHDPRLIAIEWKNANTLLIRYPNNAGNTAEFSCQSKWADIHVECVAYEPDYLTPVAPMPEVKRGFWK